MRSNRFSLAGFVSIAVFVVASGCSSNKDSPVPAPTTVVFDLDADFSSEARFYDFPYPSDLRLTARGTPDGKAFPNPLGKSIVEGMRGIASDRTEFPVVPGASFRFTRALATREPSTVIAADAHSPILLVDVDEASPDRGALFPTVAITLVSDDYVPENVLAVAARPGFVLHGKRRYAFVVMQSLGDASGQPLGTPAALE